MVICFHAVLDPVEHDAGEAVLIEICDEALVRLGDAGSFCFLLHDTVQQIVRQMKEIRLNLLAAYGMVDIHNKRLVLEHCLKNLQHPLLPRLVRLLPLQRLRRILKARPFNEIVDILK